MEIGPGHISFDWKLIKENGEWRLQKTDAFFIGYPFQRKLETIRDAAAKLFPFLAVAKLMEPHAVFGFTPLVALVTTTFNPVAGAVSPCDGRCFRSVASETFSTIRSGAGNGSNVTAVSASLNLSASTTTDQYSGLVRIITNFDTSSIGSGSTISSATWSIYVNSTDNSSFSQSVGITSVTPATTDNVVNGDYAIANYGSTRFVTDQTIASLTPAAFNDFALNASGLSGINKTGVTSFSLRLSGDIDNVAPTWVSGGTCNVNCAMADNGSSIPKLVVTYTVSAPTAAGTLLMMGI